MGDGVNSGDGSFVNEAMEERDAASGVTKGSSPDAPLHDEIKETYVASNEGGRSSSHGSVHEAEEISFIIEFKGGTFSANASVANETEEGAQQEAGTDNVVGDVFAAENLPKCSSQSRPKTCPFCCCVFPSDGGDDAQYRHHLKEELGIFRGKSICPECQLDCRWSYKLIDHFFTRHGELKRFVCGANNCVQAFWTRDELNAHVQSRHVS